MTILRTIPRGGHEQRVRTDSARPRPRSADGPNLPQHLRRAPLHDPGQRAGIAQHATPTDRPALGPERSRLLSRLGLELLRPSRKSPRPDSPSPLASGPTGPAADLHHQLVVGRTDKRTIERTRLRSAPPHDPPPNISSENCQTAANFTLRSPKQSICTMDGCV